MKRIFDVIVSSIFLLMAAPVGVLLAILIRLDSPGPILYKATKVGKDGKVFGMFRFRTVELSKPDYLHMNERLTRVGRFIREYSLDDLPNLLNILTGDLSVIGPRPTEPERVNGSEPSWQQILTVRPGMISPAILALGSRYNSSPSSTKQQLELEYVRNQSFQYDLALFWQSLRGFISSKGNWKARGKPSATIEYATYQPTMPLSAEARHLHAAPSAWNVVDWQRPDLSFVAQLIDQQGDDWEHNVPQFCLVPCGDSELKPALFLKVANGYEQWSNTVELKDVQWPVVANNRYLCLGCTLFFEDRTEASSAMKASEESDLVAQQPHRLVCSAILDVASIAVETWFLAWQQILGDIPLFVVSHDLVKMHHMNFATHSHRPSHSEFKAQALQQWQTTKTRLQRSNHALENFSDEREMLSSTLPHKVE